MIVSEFMNNLTDPTESYPVPAAISVGRATNERLEMLLAEIRGLRADLRQAQTSPAQKPARKAPPARRKK